MSRPRFLQVVITTTLVALISLGFLTISFFPRTHASAAPGLVTRGDAEAIFNAALTGCAAVLAQGNLHEGQPCEDTQRAQLRLFAPLPTQHYCVDDWHVVRITVVFEVAPGDTNQGTRQKVDEFTASFVLDGQPLDTSRTPAKPVTPPSASALGVTTPAYWANIGTLLPPEALGVGSHSSHVETFDPSTNTTSVFDSVFVIDPSGTGACLQS